MENTQEYKLNDKKNKEKKFIYCNYVEVQLYKFYKMRPFNVGQSYENIRLF